MGILFHWNIWNQFVNCLTFHCGVFWPKLPNRNFVRWANKSWCWGKCLNFQGPTTKESLFFFTFELWNRMNKRGHILLFRTGIHNLSWNHHRFQQKKERKSLKGISKRCTFTSEVFTGSSIDTRQHKYLQVTPRSHLSLPSFLKDTIFKNLFYQCFQPIFFHI